MEINSTFYRPHRASTYARWAETTPPGFRFAVKLPRAITHEARLVDVLPLARAFRAQVEPLDGKLGPLLVQLPPSLAFEAPVARSFFAGLRDLWPGSIVCEPRHASWFEAEPDVLLASLEIARVAADPARCPQAATPGGWRGLAYWRLHGSPRMYRSAYDEPALAALASALRDLRQTPAWCIFDNTASGAAAADALRLKAMLPA